MKDVASRVAELLGKHVSIEIKGRRSWISADSTLAGAELGWLPKTKFDDGLKNSIDFIKQTL